MNDFSQPSLDDAEAPAVIFPTDTAVVAVDNTDNTDELSLAVAAASAPKPVTVVEAPAPIGKYFLDYIYKGKKIRETHATVRHALAGYQRLGRLGITPATGTL